MAVTERLSRLKYPLALVFVFLLSLLFLYRPASALPHARPIAPHESATDPNGDSSNKQGFSGPHLRIMPFGDSITWGGLSSTGNGYRGPLQKLLLASGGTAGREVDFIGSHRHGGMADSDNEAWTGNFLAQLLPKVKLSIGANPNVALVHAGTNDMDFNTDFPTAIDRLEAIVRAIADGSPGVTILLARIIFSTDVDLQKRSDVYNDQISELVKKLSAGGMKIVEVDMSKVLTKNDLKDKKHPNDGGYAKMARVWSDAIASATSQGLITDPKNPATMLKVGLGVDGKGIDLGMDGDQDGGAGGASGSPSGMSGDGPTNNTETEGDGSGNSNGTSGGGSANTSDTTGSDPKGGRSGSDKPNVCSSLQQLVGVAFDYLWLKANLDCDAIK